MSNANPTRLGQDNLTGDVRQLFYKLFTGEVLSVFNAKNVLMGRHRQRNITHGKSASFANTGRARGRYHTPGTEILGQNIRKSETVITIDDLLIADVFISNIDEAMNHFEVRGEYSTQLGEALARTYDKQGFRSGITAARSANAIQGEPGGSQITLTAGYAAASELDKARELASALFLAHKTFLEKDVPLEGVTCFLRPEEYFLLVQNKDLLNKDWGGLGSYAQADLPMVAGIPLQVTNHLPRQNDASFTSNGETTDGIDVIHSKYVGDYSRTRMLVMTPEAIGTVNLLDLALESEYDIRRQGTLMVAKKLCGTGVLRPPCAIEVRTAA